MKPHIFSLVAFWFVLAAALSAAAPSGSGSLQVEIMIYSGRPNPVFTVTDAMAIREILGAAKALSRASSATVPPHPKLGYRGIVVTNRSTFDADVESITVQRSIVQLKPTASASISSSAPEGRFDGSAALEQRLLAMAEARGVVSAAALAHIRSTK